MEPTDLGIDCDEPPLRNSVRAFWFGALTGPITFIGGLWLIDAGRAARSGFTDPTILEFIAQSVAAMYGVLLILMITFPFSGLAAALCLTTLMAAEERFPVFRGSIPWMVTGALFAFPVGWVFNLAPGYTDFMPWLATGCGAVGGLGARWAYYGKQIRSAP